MYELHSNFERAKSWLLNSGICISDPSDKNSGSVHSFFDEKKNEFSFLYPEITGYYLSTMRFLFDIEKSNNYLKNGNLTADWLMQLNFNSGSKLTRTEAHGTAARFWVQYHENEKNVLLNIGEEE